jgi:hypothetical protein
MVSNSILPDWVKQKYNKEILFIRNCASSGLIRISNHCYQQISQRNIRLSDIYESIKNGVIIEVQDYERDIKILFQDSVNNPPAFFVTVAVKPTMGLCVTAYLPDEDKWELGADNQWRRKQNV